MNEVETCMHNKYDKCIGFTEILPYVSVKSKLQHATPPGIPGHLTPLPSRGGGNLIIRVFQGVGNLIPMLKGWGI